MYDAIRFVIFFLLTAAAVSIYIAWLRYRLHREIRARRPPAVARDGFGRPLRERL